MNRTLHFYDKLLGIFILDENIWLNMLTITNWNVWLMADFTLILYPTKQFQLALNKQMIFIFLNIPS